MATTKQDSKAGVKQRRPATTQEARERQLISDAYDLAEKQIADGTVSAQVLSHFLKLGSEREKLEREKLKLEARVLTSRAEQIDSGKRMEELYGQAIEAMREYGGHVSPHDEYYDD